MDQSTKASTPSKRRRPVHRGRQRPRAERFHDVDQLREATRAEVLAEIARKWPYPDGAKRSANGVEQALRRRFPITPQEYEAGKVLRRFQREAAKFIDDHPDPGPNEDRLRVLHELARNSSPDQGHRLAYRTLVATIALLHSSDRAWWWHGVPKARDLALLTLALGEFPDVRGEVRRQGATVARVIEKEAVLIRNTIGRVV
ncbi:MAG: hypothetical protein ACOCXM_03185 [Myxococcota bacterium]